MHLKKKITVFIITTRTTTDREQHTRTDQMGRHRVFKRNRVLTRKFQTFLFYMSQCNNVFIKDVFSTT